MALSIKTEEADRLARQLASMTGETMTEAVTGALRERIGRLAAEREVEDDLAARLEAFHERYRDAFDRRPVTRAEWDWASGEEE